MQPMTVAKDTAVKDTDNFTFLNAYNFDFGGHLQSNYLGHINVFKVYPLNDNTKIIKGIGFNIGVMKISYNGTNQDSTSNTPNNYVQENVLIHPLDSIKAGAKYLRQENKYSLTKQNTVWSLYVQPLFLLNSDPDNQIFFHLHAELLVNDWVATTKITTVQQDTAIVTTPNKVSIRQNIGNNIVYKTTLLNGYFGAGITLKLTVSESSKFFFQPTIGLTTNTPNFASIDINSNVFYVKSDGMSGFYLVRASYQQEITKDKLTLVLGTDIRGLFPTFPPMYAVYIGAKLNLAALSKLIQ